MRSTIRIGQPDFTASDIPDILSSMRGALRSGWLTNNGPLVSKFEEEFRRIVGTRYAVMVNSGTAALHIILASFSLLPKDEVVVPANTFASTLGAVLFVGATPVLADCDPNSYNVTADTLEEAISPSTKVVMITHVGGNPCEMDGIRSLCRKKGVALVEDAAHAHGAKYKGKMCGSFGKANAFSFTPTKVLTSAEGGAITTDSNDINRFSRLFRNVGRAKMGRGPIQILGNNYRMSEIHAAIGRSQLRHLTAFVKKRNLLAKQYEEELRGIDWLERQSVSGHSLSSYYTYIVRMNRHSPMGRDMLLSRLRGKAIEAAVMFLPLFREPFFRVRGLTFRAKCPNADLVGKRTIALPLHSSMSYDDVRRISRCLTDLAR